MVKTLCIIVCYNTLQAEEDQGEWRKKSNEPPEFLPGKTSQSRARPPSQL